MQKILIVEDDFSFGALLQTWFKKNHFEVILCSRTEDAKKELHSSAFDLILSDLRLPDGDGIMLLAWIKEKKIPSPVIIMTNYAEIQTAVSAIKLGAFDFLEKPINYSVFRQKIDAALKSSQNIEVPPRRKAIAKKDAETIVIGVSKIAQEIYKHIELVAPTQLSVLILGESGSGKEYVAKLIHQKSNRSEMPFMAVDCGALSKELAPSELFGHLKGSFTSAVGDKIGIFVQANKGTVFLDEIGNLSYDVQIQLLRVLQEQKIRPVGSNTDIKIDVRIIVATNENLEKGIEKGSFREDLYHRLNEFMIYVPPLREREDDFALFANHFLKEANEELGKQVETISKEAMQKLKEHHWSGNFRELRNVIRRSVLFAESHELLPENLPVFPKSTQSEPQTNFNLYAKNEPEQIRQALQKANGNKTLAAQLLNIDRKTLYNKIHLYKIDV